MDNVYIHTKNNLKMIVLKYILFLLPLIFYGIYKNGILLYQKSIISFILIFKVLFLILIGVIIDFIIRIIFKKKLHFDYDLLSCIIIPLFMPFNINFFLYTGVLFASLILYELLSKLIKINKSAFIILTILLSILYTSNLNFLNPLEESNIYVFNTLDLLWGRNVGGIASTSILWGLVLLFLGTTFNDYKWFIPIVSIFVFLSIAIILNTNINLYINSMAIVSFILLHIDTRYTPINTIECIIYSLFLGILTYFSCVYINYYFGVFISVIIVNFCFEMINILVKKKYL